MPPEPDFEGRPVTPFEDLARNSPRGNSTSSLPCPRQMNRQRRSIYECVKKQGYQCITYLSSRATLFPGTPIGENCFILEDNTIQPCTRIGDNVVLWSGNHIGHHSSIGDHAMITSHVVLSGHCTVGAHCYLGVNATIRDGLKLGEGTLVAMGACLGRDTEPWSVYHGNPARKREMSSTDVEI